MKKKKNCKFIVRKTRKRCRHTAKYPLSKPVYCTVHYVEIKDMDKRFMRK